MKVGHPETESPMSHHPFAISFLGEKLLTIGAIMIVICSLEGETDTQCHCQKSKWACVESRNIMTAGRVGGLDLQAPPPTLLG